MVTVSFLSAVVLSAHLSPVFLSFSVIVWLPAAALAGTVIVFPLTVQPDGAVIVTPVSEVRLRVCDAPLYVVVAVFLSVDRVKSLLVVNVGSVTVVLTAPAAEAADFRLR